MQEALGMVFVGLIVSLFLGTLVYLVQAGRLLRRLATQHAALHESLGRPYLFSNNNVRNNRALLRWFWNREYESLDDALSLALARQVHGILRVIFIGLLLMIPLYFAFMFLPN